MAEPSFLQRFGLVGKPIIDDFPKEAIVALAYLFDDIVRKHFVDDWYSVFREIGRCGAITEIQFDATPSIPQITDLLESTEWHRIYSICESVYRHLTAPWDYNEDYNCNYTTGKLEDAQKYYEQELNQLLAEHNLGYSFEQGLFCRRGRRQTQISSQRVGVVLVQERFTPVRAHFVKAQKFFAQFPEPDAANAVKEAICALEACLQIVSNESTTDLPKLLNKLQGNGPKQVPPPIAQIMVKLYGYRGDARGVAHAALKGSRVEVVEAELVLNLAASCITYLADLYPEEEDEIPF